MKKAIFLAGGGARAAYQVGALLCISDILRCGKFPANILSTVSAGAINGAYLANHADDFKFATNKLVEMWSSLSCDKIFHADNMSMLKSLSRNIKSMVLHSYPKSGQHLLDTQPLHDLLSQQLDFERIHHNINNGTLEAFEVATTCFESAQTVSFVHSKQASDGWRKIRHFSQSAQIKQDHIMASAAFPLFFPVVNIDDLHYGDGGLRQAAPLRASIKLGAEAILIIGTRKTPTIDGTIHPKPINDINFTKIIGGLFNAFLDNLDRDLEHLNTINENFRLMDAQARKETIWRDIHVLHLTPSIDIAKIAVEKELSLPTFFRYLMESFGKREQSGDFLSFLLFEADYTKDLIDIGYQDTLKRKDEVELFFSRNATSN